MLSAFARSFLYPLQAVSRLVAQTSGFHSCGSQAAVASTLAKPEGPLLTLIRTKVRCYFPRPSETKRVRRHGWVFRMSTPNGRRTIMRRILKGRHVLSH